MTQLHDNTTTSSPHHDAPGLAEEEIGQMNASRNMPARAANVGGAPRIGLTSRIGGLNLRIGLASLLVLAVSVVFSAGVAWADAPTLGLYGNFSPPIKGQEKGTGLSSSVAVDSSGPAFAGDVYTVAFLNYIHEGNNFTFFPPVYQTDAAGGVLSPPSPFGEEFGFALTAAVNPVNEHLDVFEQSGFIQAYDPSDGEPLASESFPVESSGSVTESIAPQIGFDKTGDVYVPDPAANKVLEYSPAGTLLETFTGGAGEGALKDPRAVAVDSAGDVWVADTGDGRIEKLDPSGAPAAEIRAEGVRTLALDGHGDVFAILKNSEDFCGSIAPPCSHLVEYDAAGRRLADVGAGSFGSTSSSSFDWSLVAVNEANGRVYVSDGPKGKVWIFGPTAAPTIRGESSAEVRSTEAKLGARVGAGALPTSYRFEYGTTPAYGASVPFPEGSVGEGIATHTVWAGVSGLEAGVTYHYRVVATNALGTVAGGDQTFTTLSPEQAACPNEATRGGFSARLPDCRAFELVTPPTKASVQITTAGPAAGNGDAVGFATEEPLPGQPSAGYYYIARRGAGGWGEEDIIPLESYSGGTCVSSSNAVVAFTGELSTALISFGDYSRASEPGGSALEKQECNAEGLQVVAGEPIGYKNLLLRDNTTGGYRLLNAPPAGVTPADAHFKGASADLSHVVFGEMTPLAAGARYGVEGLYEWDEGVVRLLTVLPDGTPVTGSLPGVELPATNGISSDGSRVLFVSGGGLYVRVDGQRTVQVDESQEGSGSSGGGVFQAASADGREVFFTDESKLTPGSTAVVGEPDLYECVLAEGASRCQLRDLTIAAGGEHADVLSVSPLGSKDDSHVYFTAEGVLASNTRQYTDSEGHVVQEKAQAGEHNLYMWDGATTTFISTLSEGDFGEGQASPDGSWFAFASHESLTGYDSTQPEGEPANEVFLYSAVSGQLSCASCNPTGETPISGGGAEINLQSLDNSERRFVSDGGRVFFGTREALVPADTNSKLDVYEYENGHVYLVSSGTSARISTFMDASESGNDVFFLSTQQLVTQDSQPEAPVVYDARVDGGFVEPALPPACGDADACRAPVSGQPSLYGAPSSQTFTGAGNLTPPPEPRHKSKPRKKTKPHKCSKGHDKSKGRCVGASGPRRAGKSKGNHGNGSGR